MPWTWPPPRPLGKPAPKPSDQHVLELPLATLRHPKSTPLHQGPLPCPHLPELCRPTHCRTPRMRARTRATPADQHPPEARPTTSMRPHPPWHPLDTAPCLPSPARCRPWTAARRPCRPRPCLAAPVPPSHQAAPAYIKATPGHYPAPHHDRTPPPSPRSSREELELHSSCSAAEAMPPP